MSGGLNPQLRRIGAAALVSTIAFVGAGASGADAHPGNSDSISVRSAGPQVLAVAAATRHATLRLRPGHSIQFFVSTGVLRRVSVRAKAARCGGRNGIQVRIDGRRVLSRSVSSHAWRVYGKRLRIASGRHRVRLAYSGAGASLLSRCRREVQIANLRFTQRRPPAPRAPKPPSKPASTPSSSPASSSSSTVSQPAQPTSSTTSPFWSGDFSTGDLSQWTILSPDALANRISVTNDVPGLTGGNAGRFEIAANDPSPDPTDPTQQRAEVRASEAQSMAFPGSEVWYGWSVYFPSPGFETPTENPNTAHPETFFTQWKRTDGHCGSPNVFFEVDSPSDPGFFMGVEGGVNQTNSGSSSNCPGTTYNSYRLGDFAPGRWYDFVFHVRWSSDPSVGFVEVWLNGVNVLPKTFHSTLYRDWNMTTDYGAYLRQGELRISSADNSSVLYIAHTRTGDSYQSVASDLQDVSSQS